MQFRERFLRVYSEADWFAHLLLATCIVALLNFLEVLSETTAAAQAAGTRVVDGFEITVCYFGPPPSFYPRFFIFVALLGATLCAFKRTAGNRLIASLGSGVALAIYVVWWVDSYRSFCNLKTLHVKQFAYLYDGTPIDLGIAVSTAVCLVLLLDRLCDGEKTQSSH